jgi:hypothetical protein
MNHYEEKQAARKARLEELAIKAEEQADSLNNRAKEMASVIPFGQPIIIGHHSEGTDRRYRARIHNMFHKAYALREKAETYQDKALSVGNGGISSDDPEAIIKLREKLTKLESIQEKMKEANKLVRRKDRTGLTQLGFSEESIDKLLMPDFCGRLGFPKFELQNNNANIRHIKLRIRALEELRQRSDKELQGDGYIYKEDVEDNRILFIFPGKPDEATLSMLKHHSFKWSQKRKAWVRQLNNRGLWVAEQVRKILDNASRD